MPERSSTEANKPAAHAHRASPRTSIQANQAIPPMQSVYYSISHTLFSITPIIKTPSSQVPPLLLAQNTSPKSSLSFKHYCAFCCCCALAALAAFLRLLRTMTTLRKLPTTAPPSSSRMTGMRMAQTRGGKRDWIACESSTKGCWKWLVRIDWGSVRLGEGGNC
jgi:hypothetical protein